MTAPLLEVNWEDVGAPPHVWPASKYDSPLEHRFAHEAAKYFGVGIDLVPQVGISTPRGRFRIDFYVFTGANRIAFECDGRAFHTGPAMQAHDAARDQAILQQGIVDVIYRIPGHALWVVPDGTFYVVSRHDPELFSVRGLTNLANLRRRFRKEPTLERLRMTRRVRA